MGADFRRARDAAADVWGRQQLYGLSVDVTRLRYEQAIVFDSMQRFCARTRATIDRLAAHRDLQDGCTIVTRRNGAPLYLVLYNEQAANLRRRAFTLAHEVGHICLGHKEDGPVQEAEADCFAGELLMPRILVYELRRRSASPVDPVQLCAVFNISRQAAGLALGRLREVGEDAFSPLEQSVLRRYRPLLPDTQGPVVDL